MEINWFNILLREVFKIKYGLLNYKLTRNYGDQIQSIAATKFLPKIDYFIERDKLSQFYSDYKVKTILNAWYFHFKSAWPPSDAIEPLLISMHINLTDENVVNSFLSDESREYLTKYGPVGARDITTMNFFKDNDIPSYFSGCLTLTLDKNPKIHTQDYIVAVDLPPNVLSFLKSKTTKKIYNISHMVPLNISQTPPLDIDKLINNLESLFKPDEKFAIAENLLNLYQGASCVITNRLHAALPCLALETPVLLLNNYNYDIDRFSGLDKLLWNISIEEYFSNYNFFNIENPPENKKNYIKIRNDLIEKCKKFTGCINEHRMLFNKDSNFYISLLSKTSKSINLYGYENNLLYKKMNDDVKFKENIIEKQNKAIENKNNTIKKQKGIIKKMKLSNSWKLTKPLRNLNNFFK